MVDYRVNEQGASLPVAGDGPHLLRQGPEGGVTDKEVLELELLRDVGDFCPEVFVTGGDGGDVSRPLFPCFCLSLSLHQEEGEAEGRSRA